MPRRNCASCTRWLHALEFPYRTASSCARCEREAGWRDHISFQRTHVSRVASHDRAIQRVASGAALWLEPFRTWLLEPDAAGVERIARLGYQAVAGWGDVDEKTIRQLVAGAWLTVDFELVDRILLRAPGPMVLSTLYPLDVELDEPLEAA